MSRGDYVVDSSTPPSAGFRVPAGYWAHYTATFTYLPNIKRNNKTLYTDYPLYGTNRCSLLATYHGPANEVLLLFIKIHLMNNRMGNVLCTVLKCALVIKPLFAQQ